MSISQIGEKTGRSSATVRHWLLEYGHKTRCAEQRCARLADVVVRECPKHGLTEFGRRSSGGHSV